MQRTNQLVHYLNNRGHDKAFLITQIQRASDVPRADAIKDNPPTPLLSLLHVTLHCLMSRTYSPTFPLPLLH